MLEKTGTYYICKMCSHIWGYKNDTCPECGEKSLIENIFPLTQEDLKNGLVVKTLDNQTGIIVECSDLHNVFFDGSVFSDKDGNPLGGQGFYCFDKNCDESLKEDPLFKL